LVKLRRTKNGGNYWSQIEIQYEAAAKTTQYLICYFYVMPIYLADFMRAFYLITDLTFSYQSLATLDFYYTGLSLLEMARKKSQRLTFFANQQPMLLILLPSPSLSERRRYCDSRRHADTLSRCVCVPRAATARRISLGGEGNALYPVFYSLYFLTSTLHKKCCSSFLCSSTYLMFTEIPIPCSYLIIRFFCDFTHAVSCL